MANGLESGDSIKGTDTFMFFRGERSVNSPGERFVPISDLVTYLNDTSVLTALSGGGGANQSQVDSNTFNIGLNSMRLADSDTLVAYDVIDGLCDVFSDATTGVDQTASTGETYDATDDHFAGSAMVLISQTFTAQEAPTTAKAVVLYKDTTSSTLNTDCTLEISMDGGSTYSTAFTLEDSGTNVTLTAGGGNTVDVLTTNTLTLDSTSGTSIKWRWSNLNSKDQEIHGIYLRWD